MALLIGVFGYCAVIIFNQSGCSMADLQKDYYPEERLRQEQEADRVVDRIEEGVERTQQGVQKIKNVLRDKPAQPPVATPPPEPAAPETPAPTAEEYVEEEVYEVPVEGFNPAIDFAPDGEVYRIQLASFFMGKFKLDKYQNISDLGTVTSKRARLKTKVLIGDYLSKEQADYFLKEIIARGHEDAFIFKLNKGDRPVVVNTPSKSRTPKAIQKTRKSSPPTAKAIEKTTVAPLNYSENSGKLAIQLGKFKKPNRERLSRLNQYGTVYMIKDEKANLYTAYLGNFRDQRSLNIVLRNVTQQGYKGAFETKAVSIGSKGMIFVTNDMPVNGLRVDDFIIQLVTAASPDVTTTNQLVFKGNVYRGTNTRNSQVTLFLGPYKDIMKANKILEEVMLDGFQTAFIKSVEPADLENLELVYHQSSQQ